MDGSVVCSSFVGKSPCLWLLLTCHFVNSEKYPVLLPIFEKQFSTRKAHSSVIENDLKNVGSLLTEGTH